MYHLRQIVRRSIQAPGFPLLTVFTLALGLGATSAILGVVSSVLLEPLPYDEPDRLVVLDHTAPGLDLERMDISEALFLFYRENVQSLQQVSLIREGVATLSGLDQPRRLKAATLTPGTSRMLGIKPLLGRAFAAEEESPDAPGTVLISEALWQTHLGGRPEILGATVQVDGISRQVVGVLPRTVTFPEDDVDLWLPYALDPTSARLGNFESFAIARLAPGFTIEEAHTELDHYLERLPDLFPEDPVAGVLAEAAFRARPHPLRERVIGDVGTSLWLLLGTVVFVLLIALANVANLHLVRAEARRREAALRTALGADRRQHLQANFLESGLQALLAGGLGLVLAAFGLELLRRLGPQDLPRLTEIHLDERTLALTAALTLLITVLFGLLPSAIHRAHHLSTVLRDAGRSATAGRSSRLFRHSLVATQVALALVLLVGAGLMVRSYQNLIQVDPGFRVDETLTFRLSLPPAKYTDDQVATDLWNRLLERLESLPGVKSAAASSSVPLANHHRRSGHTLEGRETEEGSLPLVFDFEWITESYLETAGIRLLEGRSLTRSDAEHRSGAVLVNETLARRHWPGEKALGQRLDPGSGLEDPWYTVVGVVADVRVRDLAQEPEPTVYYPLTSKEENGWVARNMDVVVRYQGERATLMPALRQAVWDLDPDLPLAQVQTFASLVARSQKRQAFTLTLLLLASGMALILSTVGTYGVIAYLVARRTSEIGIRLALGARGRQVATQILGQSLRVAAVGAAGGWLAAAVLSRWLESLLFEVSPLDPATFVTVPSILLIAALLASWIPARRASRVDPLIALRHE